MNPFIEKAIGSLVRTLLAGLVPWLVAKGMLGADDAEQLVTLLAAALIAGGWGVWEKWQSHEEKKTALALPEGSSLADLKDARKGGG